MTMIASAGLIGAAVAIAGTTDTASIATKKVPTNTQTESAAATKPSSACHMMKMDKCPQKESTSMMDCQKHCGM